MAGVAINGGMRAGQRKTTIVLLYLLHRNLPSTNRVALLAVRSELSLVDVGVAILAALADAGKYRLDVTLGALDRLVHTP